MGTGRFGFVVRLAAVVLMVLVVRHEVVRAQDLAPAVRAHAVRRTGPIAIDGQLDEADWAAAPRQAGFVQRFPKDAAKPSLETSFAIVYDDEAIFVGVWADDPRPDQILALLTRRDVDSPADSVTVAFDSYHDRRTAYVFQLNAAGVQRDMLLFDDTNLDDSWDAVWTASARVTASGWTAEYRIPLSQLRFASARRLELLPYATGGVDRIPVADGDPLNQRYTMRRGLGLDLKYGLGPAFTLSATLNPDFGQVEADPSKINLSASELFFAEKRPFFLEGSDLFKLQIGNSDNGSEGAFYSRRIGATPAQPDASTFDYIKAPQPATIYGAAKLTGKSSGWSVGVLDAVTGQEKVDVYKAATPDTPDTPGAPAAESHPVVAPLTNYAIARIKRDFGEGKTSVGASATAVDRKLDGTGLEASLHDQAYTGGLQLQHRWADNAWTANASLLGSWVHGSPEAIAQTQQSSVHYFQRPDATDARFDPTRTSLSGLAAKWLVGQLGDTAHWRYGTGGDLRTPGLELNDAGYQIHADRLIPYVWAQYHEDEPGAHFLNWQVNSDVFVGSTFEPRVTDVGLEYNANIQFANYWSLSTAGNADRARWSTSALRGGGALRADPSFSGYVYLQTDTRKPVWLYLNSYGSHTWTSGQIDGGVELIATIQARANVDVSIGPSLYARNDPMQYVTEIPVMEGPSHFIFGRIHETDASLTLRVNWTFSPHLGLQAYAQPYIASGHYGELKDVNNPGARRYQLGDDSGVLPDGTILITRPDFNFRQLRSTVVLRWEYRPGSTVFAIWSHGRTSDTFDDGRFRFGRDLSDLGRAASENVVMVKANYWIGL